MFFPDPVPNPLIPSSTHLQEGGMDKVRVRDTYLPFLRCLMSSSTRWEGMKV